MDTAVVVVVHALQSKFICLKYAEKPKELYNHYYHPLAWLNLRAKIAKKWLVLEPIRNERNKGETTEQNEKKKFE